MAFPSSVKWKYVPQREQHQSELWKSLRAGPGRAAPSPVPQAAPGPIAVIEARVLSNRHME